MHHSTTEGAGIRRSEVPGTLYDPAKAFESVRDLTFGADIPKSFETNGIVRIPSSSARWIGRGIVCLVSSGKAFLIFGFPKRKMLQFVIGK